MNRNKIEKLVSILKAHLDGKEIEFYSSTFNKWKTSSMNSIATLISNIDNYRIKPEPKYRPFANAEECWQEMLKHKPFGWVKCKGDGSLGFITLIINEESIYINSIGSNSERTMREFTFADGTPFGILEEE